MKVIIQVNLETYEIIDNRTKTALGCPIEFHSRYDIEQFVEAAASSDIAALHEVLDDPTIPVTNRSKLMETIVEKIEQGLLSVQQPDASSGGSQGGGASSLQPELTENYDTEGISDIYSNDMKQYIAANRSAVSRVGSINASKSPSSQNATDAGTQQKLNYKIVIEIAGRNPCPKQYIEIQPLSSEKTAEHYEKSQKKRAQHHNRDRHRSIIEFKNIPNTPRSINLVVPTKGYGADIRLPLNIDVAPVDIQKENPEWDNVFIPVKPLAYVTKANSRQQADILKPGWIYIFWHGKLWRELHVQKNQAMQDVQVEYYRRNWNGHFGLESDREAEGHWLTAAWVPYKLNGVNQTGPNAPLMMYSHKQLDWPYIESLESDQAKLNEEAAALDLSTYSQEQHFKNAKGNMGSIETALKDQDIDAETHQYDVISEKGKDLRGYRDSLVPVVFLNTATDKFLLTLRDKKGKPLTNKKIVLDTKEGALELSTNNDGILELTLEDTQLSGELCVFNEATDTSPAYKVPFSTEGDLLPDVSTIKGQQARLNNLGFNAGVVDGLTGKKTKAATIGFQKHRKLKADSVCGPKTQKNLKQVYQQ